MSSIENNNSNYSFSSKQPGYSRENEQSAYRRTESKKINPRTTAQNIWILPYKEDSEQYYTFNGVKSKVYYEFSGANNSNTITEKGSAIAEFFKYIAIDILSENGPFAQLIVKNRNTVLETIIQQVHVDTDVQENTKAELYLLEMIDSNNKNDQNDRLTLLNLQRVFEKAQYNTLIKKHNLQGVIAVELRDKKVLENIKCPLSREYCSISGYNTRVTVTLEPVGKN